MSIDQFITRDKRVNRFGSKEELKDYIYELIVRYFGFNKVIDDLNMGQETHQHLRMFIDIEAWIKQCKVYDIYEIIESDGYLYLIENDPLRKEEQTLNNK